MEKLKWEEEPDLDELRKLHAELANNPIGALPGLEALGERGSLASALYLADFYMESSPYADTSKANYWYFKAHERGYPPGSYMVGRAYVQSGEYELAYSAFLKGTEKGYAPAIYRLAKMHQSGKGVARDTSEYRRLLELAYSKGHIFAKRDLAGLLLTGKFGFASAVRGAMLLLSLWPNIALLIWMAVKRSPLDDRVLA